MTIICGSSPVTVSNTMKGSVQGDLSENNLYPRISGVNKTKHGAVKKLTTCKESDLEHVLNAMNFSLFYYFILILFYFLSKYSLQPQIRFRYTVQ